MSGVRGAGVDVDADRSLWLGRALKELRSHRRESYDTLRAWLHFRGMGTRDGIIIDRPTSEQRIVDLDALRSNRPHTSCFKCGSADWCAHNPNPAGVSSPCHRVGLTGGRAQHPSVFFSPEAA